MVSLLAGVRGVDRYTMPCDIHTHGGEGGQDDESIDCLGIHDGVRSMMKLPLLRWASNSGRLRVLAVVSTLVA